MPDRDWNKPCEAEQWSVASTACHIGAGHLAIYEMAQMVVNGDGLPQLDMNQITAMSNKQASDNAHCSKADVLEQVNANRDKMIEFVIFHSAANHLKRLETTVGM